MVWPVRAGRKKNKKMSTFDFRETPSCKTFNSCNLWNATRTRYAVNWSDCGITINARIISRVLILFFLDVLGVSIVHCLFQRGHVWLFGWFALNLQHSNFFFFFTVNEKTFWYFEWSFSNCFDGVFIYCAVGCFLSDTLLKDKLRIWNRLIYISFYGYSL